MSVNIRLSTPYNACYSCHPGFWICATKCRQWHGALRPWTVAVCLQHNHQQPQPRPIPTLLPRRERRYSTCWTPTTKRNSRSCACTRRSATCAAATSVPSRTRHFAIQLSPWTVIYFISTCIGLVSQSASRCLLSLVLFLDLLGFTYERAAILHWMQHHDSSPMTRQILQPVLVPNHSVRQ